ncbi:rRNA guanine-N1-methyltransferase [Cellvibrio sp. PSBB023]|nr:rRNA guanine-N1-methyltransferase [Cellvibrio sp. PSBB023]
MNALSCPLCRLPLMLNSQGVGCGNRHQFDRAKEGYLNLLPVQQKHSREPGDAKAQLQARRQFLQVGFFSPLRQRLQQVLPASAQQVLDIGCGEGYFTQGIAEALGTAQVYGMDIAKAGVRLAAKTAKSEAMGTRLIYAVASSFDLPLADESMDLVTRIYAPSKDAELYRVIKSGGMLVIVSPGEQHLLGLRQRIYREVRPHQLTPVPEGFRLIEQQSLLADLTIAQPELRAALLDMTPFAWRMSAELKASLINELFVDRMDFTLSLYNKM